MKTRIILITQFIIQMSIYQTIAQNQPLTAPVISSPWAENVNKESPHQEYPRPQMTRETWVNLNGQWDYAIVSKSEPMPPTPDGKITVPFAVESALSGVNKVVGKDRELWYKRSFEVSPAMRRGKILLHFGAVDWEAEVFVNGKSAGIHRGGYDPFSFEINSFLQNGKSQELSVRVWDPSDDGPQPRGKQINNPNSIWYTPVTGIWQTVWLEPVPTAHIEELKNTPDFDRGIIHVEAKIASAKPNQKVVVRALDGENVIAEQIVNPGEQASLAIPDPTHWTPQNPFLYDLEISLNEGNKTVDQVKGYAGIRKISMAPDENGIQRMLLNDEFLFQYGPLDQGWWPDGLYTAPTDEALVFDIIKTKEMGFNMIRKHVKVEPARWYYHTDRLGILVWQDMPNGDHGNNWESRPGVIGKGTERDRSADSESIYRTEWKEIMDANYNFPSIVVWVPFNEAWGQFKTREITEWTQEYDPTRLVNSASGGNFEMEGNRITGDILDLHNYPDAVMPDPDLYGKDQIIVLGEFGGLGLPLEGHTWQQKDNWGYQSFKNKEDLTNRYESLMVSLENLIKKGLSAAVYTQTTDVEGEVNGLMTYDRKVIKMLPETLKRFHEKLYQVNVPVSQSEIANAAIPISDIY